MKLNLKNYHKIDKNVIDVEAREITIDKKTKPKCPSCNLDAGFRTDHPGEGNCFKHDLDYKVLGLYKGNGSFTEALKYMESASEDSISSIDAQMRVQHALLVKLIERADKITGDEDMGGGLHKAIQNTSKEIVRMSRTKEELLLKRLTKQDIKEQFVEEIIAALTSILRFNIEDQKVLEKISKNFDELMDQVKFGTTKQRTLTA